MRMVIKGGNVVTPDVVLTGHSLVIEDGRVVSLESDPQARYAGALHIDATGRWVVPGLIDIHVHGAVGHEVMDATPKALEGMSRFFVRHGVTAYLPTTIAASTQAIQAAIENVAHTPQPEGGAQHLGVHIEGPYLSPEFKGAQPSAQVRDPDLREFEKWLGSGMVRLVTLAPERPGALDLIDLGVRKGIEFAVGHSGADYGQLQDAVGRGLHHATHTFNGMRAMNHRAPGVVGGVLTDDRIWAQLICDGVHVHPAVAKLLFRAKGARRLILITDAILATGLGDGQYEQVRQTIVVRNGVARNSTGNLAGSTLTLEVALRNMMSFCNLTLIEALPMVTSVPAEAIGLAGRKGSLTPGADADVVLLDSNLDVSMTIVAGRIAYQVENNLDARQ
jgi:N-acetylglucosamine-6-phosphate deacetylase